MNEISPNWKEIAGKLAEALYLINAACDENGNSLTKNHLRQIAGEGIQEYRVALRAEKAKGKRDRQHLKDAMRYMNPEQAGKGE